MIQDQVMMIWVGGFFSCLMTAFPVAMLLLLPHDGWGRYIPSKERAESTRKIRALEKKLYTLEIELKIAQELLSLKNEGQLKNG